MSLRKTSPHHRFICRFILLPSRCGSAVTMETIRCPGCNVCAVAPTHILCAPAGHYRRQAPCDFQQSLVITSSRSTARAITTLFTFSPPHKLNGIPLITTGEGVVTVPPSLSHSSILLVSPSPFQIFFLSSLHSFSDFFLVIFLLTLIIFISVSLYFYFMSLQIHSFTRNSILPLLFLSLFYLFHILWYYFCLFSYIYTLITTKSLYTLFILVYRVYWQPIAETHKPYEQNKVNISKYKSGSRAVSRDPQTGHMVPADQTYLGSAPADSEQHQL